MVKTTPGKGSKGKGSATASPSKPSPQKATVSVRDQRFHETSIHKRLKTLLNEHRSCRVCAAGAAYKARADTI